MVNGTSLRNDGAERAVLGAVLVEPAALPSAGGLRPADFGAGHHRALWRVILDLDEAGTPVDLVSVKAALEAKGELAEVGGAAFIGGLVDGMPRVSNVESWAGMVRDAARLRTVVNTAERMLAIAKSGQADAHAVLERGLAMLTEAAQSAGGRVDLDFAAGIREAVQDLEAGLRGDAPGWSTGLADLDRKVGPLRPGQSIIVAGRTGTGKSTALANIGEAVAAAGGRVLLFSAEMAKREINRRRLCAEARVPASHFEPGGVTPSERDWAAIAKAEAALAARTFIIDACAPAPMEMRAKARFMASAVGLDVVLVDYLQLMPPGQGRKGENREQEVARVSRGLKRMAMDLGVVVIAASQVSRAPEGRKDPRPKLHDLRESGSQEQDADVVLMLHRTEGSEDEAEVIVAKHRNRGPGAVKVRFDGAIHRFDNLAWEGRS